MTDSIVDYAKLLRKINGEPEMQENGGMVDDHASLLAPYMWDEFVIPFWEQRFTALFYGKGRAVHVENLMPAHLPYLAKAKVDHFQPSVSDMITLDAIKNYLPAGIDVDWLLYSYHITDMTDIQIQNWVDDVVQAGISIIRTQFGAYAHQISKMDRIFAFMKAFEKYRVA